MNKGSVAAASTSSIKPPIGGKSSAWSKGPPQQQQPPTPTSAASIASRSNTPNPSANATPSHSRRPSAMAPAVALKGGQQRPVSMNFGTIDVTSPAATPAADVSPPTVNGVSRPAAPNGQAGAQPPTVKFGTIGSPPLPAASTPTTSSTTISPAPSSATTATAATSNPVSTPAPVKRKLDPNAFFQKQPTQPSASSSPSLANQQPVISSPQQRPPPLPTNNVAPAPAHHSPYYSPQQQAGPPAHLRPVPNNGGPGPRSPSFRQAPPPVNMNGTGPRPGPLTQNGTSGPANNPSAQSPRITMQTPLPQMQPPVPGQPQPNQAPPPQPFSPQQMQQPPPWPNHYWPSAYPYAYMVSPEQWGYPSPMQHSHHLAPHLQHPVNVQHPYGMQPPPGQQPPLQQPGPTPPIAHQQAIQTPSTPQPPSQPPPFPQPPPSALQPPNQAPITPMSPRHMPMPNIPPTPGTPGSSTIPLLNTNIPSQPVLSGSLTAHPITPRTGLLAGAPPFVPKKSNAVRITNPDTREAVVFRPPDVTTSPSGHKRIVSMGGRSTNGDEHAPFSPFPTSSTTSKKVITMERPEDKQKREEREREDARKKKEAEEEAERLKKEAEEEAERKRKEEEERIQREKEAEEARIEKEKEEAEERERERIRQEEEEAARIKKEEEEARRKMEAEVAAKAKAEEEERLKREEEELLARELREKEEAEKAALAAAAAAKLEAEAASSPQPSTPTLISSKPSLPPLSTTLDNRPRRPVPGPLDLSVTRQPGMPQPLPSALATARIIEDLEQVKYPEGIKTPDVELNKGAIGGKFKYDRDFLLQFMSVCKDKPDHLPPLDALGIERDEAGGAAFAGSNRSYQGGRRGNMGPPSYSTGRPASVGLGISNLPAMNKLSGFGTGTSMGNFQPPAIPGRTSDERFAASQANRAASMAYVGTGGSRHAMTRTTSQGGPGSRTAAIVGQETVPQSPREANNRTRSLRGRQRNESLKPNQGVAAASAALQQATMQHQLLNQTQGMDPVAPLQISENRWTPQSRGKTGQADDEKALVDRKVKALLNKLTMEKFDSISDQIIEFANRSVNETDGKTLIQVIKLVFEKATDEATWSEMYAKLCRKMMETISPNVRDDGVRNNEGKPIAGGQLFRKYLLNRCQEDFERGWSAKEAAVAAAASKKEEDDTKAAAAAAAKASGKDEEVELYSEEYYAALKAKRQGLGLVKFIGELFKLQMLTERIMHECIKKLLSNVDNPEEEEIESLCKLLTTVGQSLDTQKAKNHMDIYFSRMEQLAKNQTVASRVQYMLMDVIELRHRGWKARQAVAAPSTIAAVHEQAAREKAAAEAASAQYGRNAMSRGGSRRGEHTRGGDYGNQPGPDGWNVASGRAAAAPPAKAGDLSNFGKITKSGGIMAMGPSSVFKKGDRSGSGSALGLGLSTSGLGGRDPSSANSLSRAASSTNMFSLLDAGDSSSGSTPNPMSRSVSSRGPARMPSLDMNAAGPSPGNAPDTPMRKKLNLLPRSAPLNAASSSGSGDKAEALEEGEEADARSDGSGGTELDPGVATPGSTAATTKPELTDAQVKAKIAEDVKEIFAVRNISEAAECFNALSERHQSQLVDKIVNYALDKKDEDVRLASDVLAKVSSSISPSTLGAGFDDLMEFLDDMEVDVPQAYPRMGRMLKAAGLLRDAVERLAQKIADMSGGGGMTPKEKLLSAYDALA